MTIHGHRRLKEALTQRFAAGTPIRHARGVVVSSTIGQSTITLDGDGSNILAFNYGHAQRLAAGTVVDALLVGKKAYLLGAYSGAGRIVQTGTFTAVFSAASAVTGTLTFPSAFPHPPVVTATVQVGANLDILLNWQSAPITTSVAWRAFQKSGTNVSGTATVHWVAIAT